MHANGFDREGKMKQLRETRFVRITRWAIAIRLNPFRMLREERIVHLALKCDIRSRLSDEAGR